MATFISVNVNGIRDANKRLSFLQWLSHLSADFVCLQECHVTSCAESSAWFAPYDFQAVSSPGSSHSCGTVLPYRNKFELVSSFCDGAGRLASAVFKWHDVVFRVTSLYAPSRNPDGDRFLDYVLDNFDSALPTVLLGDFNTVFNRLLDRRGSDTSDDSRESTALLSTLFQELCVIDIWRRLHPHVSSFTWSRADGAFASRIDLCGYPLVWVHLPPSCDISPCPYSDHSVILLKTSFPEPFPRGPGRWVFNTSLLHYSPFAEAFRSFWSSWRLRKASFPSLLAWWDRGKKKVR